MLCVKEIYQTNSLKFTMLSNAVFIYSYSIYNVIKKYRLIKTFSRVFSSAQIEIS